jgi:SET domain
VRYAKADVGSRKHIAQQNVDAAIDLNFYDWKRRNEWPQDSADAQFCGGNNDPCKICGQTQELRKTCQGSNPQSVARTCDHNDDEVKQDLGFTKATLVELVTTRCGTGVRALDDIPQGAYLAEYIGEIYPNILGNDADHRYGGEEGMSYRYKRAFNVRRERIGKKVGNKIKYTKYTLDDDDDDEDENYWIDAAVFGNWTRYVNHSCEPNTSFEEVCIGQRHLTVVQASRDICFGEELTIWYSGTFFDDKSFRCKCGTATCQMWQPGKKGKGSRMTLATAIRNNNAAAVEFANQYPTIPANVAANQTDSTSTTSGSSTSTSSPKTERRQETR